MKIAYHIMWKKKRFIIYKVRLKALPLEKSIYYNRHIDYTRAFSLQMYLD